MNRIGSWHEHSMIIPYFGVRKTRPIYFFHPNGRRQWCSRSCIRYNTPQPHICCINNFNHCIPVKVPGTRNIIILNFNRPINIPTTPITKIISISLGLIPVKTFNHPIPIMRTILLRKKNNHCIISNRLSFVIPDIIHNIT